MVGRTGVVLPVYNGREHLASTVAALRAQTRAPLDLVAVDDGCTDGSGELLRELGVRTITRANGGVTAARNAGRRALREGVAYLLFQDQDDELEPAALETMEDYLDQHPEVGLVHSDLTIIDNDGREMATSETWPQRHAHGRFGRPRMLTPVEARTPLVSILDFVAIIPIVSLFRAEVFDDSGGWDEQHFRRGGGEDTALAVEVALRSEVHHVPVRLARYRMHELQESADTQHLHEAQVALVGRLRRRPEPQLRTAFRTLDSQKWLRRSVVDARRALQRGDLIGAARVTGGAARNLLSSARRA